MIEVEWLSGSQPQDVVQMRPCDIVMSRTVWEYRSTRFHDEHHCDDGTRDLDRVVYLGLHAQKVLLPILPADPQTYVFSLRRSEAERNARRRAGRESPLTPSQAARTPVGRPKAPLRPHYPVGSYRQAVRRACRRVGVPVCVPNQLRHARLTAGRPGR